MDKEKEFMDIQFKKSMIGSQYDEICLKEYLFLKDNPEFKEYYHSFLPKSAKNIENMEKQFPCINILSKKDVLTHYERLAILFAYLPFGTKGEERIHQILKKCSNYKKSKTQYYIDHLKSKGGSKGITCKKLQEWGICIGSKCPIYRK